MNPFIHIIKSCIDSARESILIIYDDSTENIVYLLENAIKSENRESIKIKLKIAKCHGEEPSNEISKKMLTVDSIICITQYSLAHTNARRVASERGISFLSLPGYEEKILKSSAIFIDYSKKYPQVKKYSDLLSSGKKIEIYTELGTNLTMDITNRVGNCCPGFTNTEYLLASPPDVEANIAPIENKTEGKLVIDGSITDKRIGLIKKNISLTIKNGKIISFDSKDNKLQENLHNIFKDINSENAYILGEFGIGFNENAKLCGNMLIDEGTLGCVHFGMGSNWTIGGKNKINFHLDFVMTKATVKIDGNTVIDNGRLIYE